MRAPCHRGMASPQVVDEKDCLPPGSEDSCEYIKYSRTSEKGWLCTLGLRRELTAPHLKKVKFYTG
jgi:hypothetical protein